MRQAVPLALLVLLAGCAHAPPPPPAVAPPGPTPVLYQAPFSASVYAEDAAVCPVLSCGGGGDADLLTLKANQTLLQFWADATVNGFFGAPAPSIHVEIRCTGDKRCTQPVATAEGKGPLHLRANVTLPPNTLLTVRARSLDTTTPDPLGFGQPHVQIMGEAQVRALPGPPRNLTSVPVVLSGMTGPCVPFVECSSGPGFYHTLGPLDGALRAVRLNLTWTAQSDLSRQLTLGLSCRGSGCSSSSFRQFTGPSPLHVVFLETGYPAGSSVDLSVDEADHTGTGFTGLANTRQNFELKGFFLVDSQSEE